jgi:hypothetical protein
MTTTALLLALPLAVLGRLVCATVVCVVALLRASRGDTVATVRALAGLAAALTRSRRG